MVRLRKFSLFLICVCTLLLQYSFTVSGNDNLRTPDPVKKKASVKKKAVTRKTTTRKTSVRKPAAPLVIKSTPFTTKMMSVYDSLKLSEIGLSAKVFKMALKGLEKLKKQGRIENDHILSIVDFSQPSVNKRLYIVDLDNYQLLFNTLVAHGMRSGKENAQSFSNKMSSHKSSLGFYVTDAPYMGSNGYSLKLQGVERGFNDNAGKRAIVLHGADYVNEEYISSQGYIGRSFGCPAVATEFNQPIIDQIKDGSCLFIYHPSNTYLSASRMIR